MVCRPLAVVMREMNIVSADAQTLLKDQSPSAGMVHVLDLRIFRILLIFHPVSVQTEQDNHKKENIERFSITLTREEWAKIKPA